MGLQAEWDVQGVSKMHIFVICELLSSHSMTALEERQTVTNCNVPERSQAVMGHLSHESVSCKWSNAKNNRLMTFEYSEIGVLV